MGRLIEFFEDTNGRLSMTRLLCFLSFFPASVIAYKINSAEALLYYLGAYVIGYIGGKGAEAWRARGGDDGGNTSVSKE